VAQYGKKFSKIGKMADLNSLLIFAAVVESNSFSGAAKRLRIPISTVSRRVAELETELGVRLLERSTRRLLSLTDIGSEVFAQARLAADVSDVIDGLVADQKADVWGTVRISSPPSISDTLLAPLIGAFQERYPDIRVRAFITGRYVDLVSEGVDVGFIVGPLRDHTAVARRLLRYRHRLVASPAYVAARGEPRHPDDLAAHRVLKFQFWDDELPWTFTHAHTGESRRAEFRPSVSMNDYAGIMAAIRTGAGIGDLPPIVQPHLIRDGHLVEVMHDWHFPLMDLTAVHVANRSLPRVIRLFVDFSAEFVPTLFADLPV
jgi:DNA-binding transcriptional LysR family regulator